MICALFYRDNRVCVCSFSVETRLGDETFKNPKQKNVFLCLRDSREIFHSSFFLICKAHTTNKRERDLEMFNTFYKTFMVSFTRNPSFITTRSRERTFFLLCFSFLFAESALLYKPPRFWWWWWWWWWCFSFPISLVFNLIIIHVLTLFSFSLSSQTNSRTRPCTWAWSSPAL